MSSTTPNADPVERFLAAVDASAAGQARRFDELGTELDDLLAAGEERVAEVVRRADLDVALRGAVVVRFASRAAGSVPAACAGMWLGSDAPADLRGLAAHFALRAPPPLVAAAFRRWLDGKGPGVVPCDLAVSREFRGWTGALADAASKDPARARPLGDAIDEPRLAEVSLRTLLSSGDRGWRQELLKAYPKYRVALRQRLEGLVAGLPDPPFAGEESEGAFRETVELLRAAVESGYAVELRDRVDPWLLARRRLDMLRDVWALRPRGLFAFGRKEWERKANEVLHQAALAARGLDADPAEACRRLRRTAALVVPDLPWTAEVNTQVRRALAGKEWTPLPLARLKPQPPIAAPPAPAPPVPTPSVPASSIPAPAVPAPAASAPNTASSSARTPIAPSSSARSSHASPPKLPSASVPPASVPAANESPAEMLKRKKRNALLAGLALMAGVFAVGVAALHFSQPANDAWGTGSNPTNTRNDNSTSPPAPPTAPAKPASDKEIEAVAQAAFEKFRKNDMIDQLLDALVLASFQDEDFKDGAKAALKTVKLPDALDGKGVLADSWKQFQIQIKNTLENSSNTSNEEARRKHWDENYKTWHAREHVSKLAKEFVARPEFGPKLRDVWRDRFLGTAHDVPEPLEEAFEWFQGPESNIVTSVRPTAVTASTLTPADRDRAVRRFDRLVLQEIHGRLVDREPGFVLDLMKAEYDAANDMRVEIARAYLFATYVARTSPKDPPTAAAGKLYLAFAPLKAAFDPLAVLATGEFAPKDRPDSKAGSAKAVSVKVHGITEIKDAAEGLAQNQRPGALPTARVAADGKSVAILAGDGDKAPDVFQVDVSDGTARWEMTLNPEKVIKVPTATHVVALLPQLVVEVVFEFPVEKGAEKGTSTTETWYFALHSREVLTMRATPLLLAPPTATAVFRGLQSLELPLAAVVEGEAILERLENKRVPAPWLGAVLSRQVAFGADAGIVINGNADALVKPERPKPDSGVLVRFPLPGVVKPLLVDRKTAAKGDAWLQFPPAAKPLLQLETYPELVGADDMELTKHDSKVRAMQGAVLRLKKLLADLEKSTKFAPKTLPPQLTPKYITGSEQAIRRDLVNAGYPTPGKVEVAENAKERAFEDLKPASGAKSPSSGQNDAKLYGRAVELAAVDYKKALEDIQKFQKDLIATKPVEFPKVEFRGTIVRRVDVGRGEPLEIPVVHPQGALTNKER